MVVLPAEPLSRHTALRTGGAAGAFVWVYDDEELATVVRDCRRVEWKLRVLGSGTRVVARDGDHPGVVVRLAGAFEHAVAGDDGFFEVGAAVGMPTLVTLAAQRGWSGLERFSVVPGTFGASLLHDEGWDEIVDAVYVLSRDTRKTVPRAELKDQSLVLGARLRLNAAEPAAIHHRMHEHWLRREPVAPGSWYRHPSGRKRGEPKVKAEIRDILSSVRLPLVRLRGVAVPELAPELLCNLGSGTAADLQLLHRSAIERVDKVRGIELESRIEWIGSDT